MFERRPILPQVGPIHTYQICNTLKHFFNFDLALLPYVLKIALMILNAKMRKSVIMGNVLNVPMIITAKKRKDATKIHVYPLVKWMVTVEMGNTVILITKFVSPYVKQIKIVNLDINVRMDNVSNHVAKTIHVWQMINIATSNFDFCFIHLNIYFILKSCASAAIQVLPSEFKSCNQIQGWRKELKTGGAR